MLVRAVEKLADVLGASKKPQEANPKGQLVAALMLTKDQWEELLSAINSKRCSVEKGEYTEEGDYESAEEANRDRERWAKDLTELEASILTALKDQGVEL